MKKCFKDVDKGDIIYCINEFGKLVIYKVDMVVLELNRITMTIFLNNHTYLLVDKRKTTCHVVSQKSTYAVLISELREPGILRYRKPRLDEIYKNGKENKTPVS